jgi:mRNA-degrading endonuclease toxin of MazEF toxin-antitoxin module
LEQVRVIDKSRLEKKPIYRLDDMREVDKALMISLGLAATEV